MFSNGFSLGGHYDLGLFGYGLLDRKKRSYPSIKNLLTEKIPTNCCYLLNYNNYLYTCTVNPIPNDKFFDNSKLKAFADDKRKENQNEKFFLGWKKKHWGKGENAGYQYFLLFPQCFQKPSFSRSLKVGIMC